MRQIRATSRIRLLSFAAGGLLMAAVGAVVALLITSGVASATAVADRVDFVYSDATTEQLPLIVTSAEAAGWQGSIRCNIGVGRYYVKPGPDSTSPLILVFDKVGQLAGIHLYSGTEQPEPWVHVEQGPAGVPALKPAHWRLGIYLVKPTQACGAKARGVCPSCFA